MRNFYHEIQKQKVNLFIEATLRDFYSTSWWNGKQKIALIGFYPNMQLFRIFSIRNVKPDSTDRFVQNNSSGPKYVCGFCLLNDFIVYGLTAF